MTSFRSTGVSTHSALPDSILARSSTWLMSRVRRSVSLVMMPRNFLRCAELDFGVVEQDLGERADRRERRAQLVRDGRDEVVLQPVELLQPLVGLAQLRGRRLELARLLLEPVAVDDDLRRLVEDVAHLVDRQCFFLDDGSDHDARRRAADRAGELHFDVVDELRIGGERCIGPGKSPRARVVGERAVGRGGSEEAGEQAVEVGDRRRAAPEARAAGLARLPEDVDEHARLPVLVGVGRRRQRHADVGADVRDHAPDHRVADRVEARRARRAAAASGARCRTGRRRAGHAAASPSGRAPAAAAYRARRRNPRAVPRTRRRACRLSRRSRRGSPARTARRRRTR